MRRVTSFCALLIAATVVGVVSGQAQRPGPQQPARDTPSQRQDAPPPPAGSISGRGPAADTGRPVKRARVTLAAPELPGGRGILTDDTGTFQMTELPPGRYTLSVSKSGFVSLTFGQRRPLQAGTPLQLVDNQEIRGIEFRLPRGSVIAGHVFDETGEPMPGVAVRVLRYQYQQGDRRLVPAGTAQTDDQGQYRVWGLTPGEYYVDAQTRINLGFGGPAGGRGGPAGRGGAPGVAGAIAGAIGALTGSANLAQLFAPDDDSQKAYAPTYYPGVTSIGDARPITLGLSQQSVDIDFGLQLVHVARVRGRVTDPDGTATWSGNVTLEADTATVGRGGGFGINYGSRINWDGTFDIANVPPGRYTLQARGTDNDTPQFANQPLTIGNADIDDVSVLLTESASITGIVTFMPGQTPLPDLSNLRINAPQVDGGIGPQAQGRVDKELRFTIDGLAPGQHLIRPGGNMRGWTLRSVEVNGREISDAPVELRSGERLDRVEIILSDKTTEITGTLTDDRQTPITEYTVLAFSIDPTFWRAQSRHIATARPDQTGKFRIRGLPPGAYFLATVDPAEQGEWFEPAYLDQHRAGAARVTLTDGDTKTQDFKIRSQN